ncbi:hypothetical protein HDU83_004903 [Entophlyctis luteolus]|nr:hypothetical protein HDU83_004903 [Entophlyctis luteolus]
MEAPFISVPATSSTSVEKTALILGWFRGDFKHLLKYAEWYRANSYHVIIVPCRYQDMPLLAEPPLNPAELNDLIADLQKRRLVEEKSRKPATTGKSSHFVVHVFSNGGCNVLRRLIQCLAAKQLKFVSAAAVILDSCPSLVTHTGFVRFAVMRDGCEKESLREFAVRCGAGLTSRILTLIDGHDSRLLRGIRFAISTKNLEGNLHGPRLFLYSDTDAIISYKEVQARIRQAVREGTFVVRERMFIGSEHVKHAVTFKEEYWHTVQNFIETASSQPLIAARL